MRCHMDLKLSHYLDKRKAMSNRYSMSFISRILFGLLEFEASGLQFIVK